MRRARGAGAWLLPACAALALAAACAPRPVSVAPVTAGARGARYLDGLRKREDAAGMAAMTVMLWAKARPGALAADSSEAPPGAPTGPLTALPAVPVDLLLGWPDALRLRVAPLFGVALDLAAWDDSLVAYAPGQRAGLALDARRDSLGLRAPGSLLVRLWSATWRPPPPAWQEAGGEGGLMRVRWSEGQDSLALAVDANGRPAWARVQRGDGRGVRVSYDRWEAAAGVDWPMLLRVESLDGSFTLTSRVDRVRFEAKRDSGRLALRLPAGTRPLDRARLGTLLDLMGGVR